jgi:hypothetical protein
MAVPKISYLHHGLLGKGLAKASVELRFGAIASNPKRLRQLRQA